MKVVYAKHLPYKNGHYSTVFKEMELNDDGPIIRVIQIDENEYCAVEGSHRLACAFFLKKIPRLIVLTPDEQGLSFEFWTNIKLKLPKYKFDSVLVMEEKNFDVSTRI